MRSLLITSTRKAAGKTTVGLGIALNSAVKCGYFKPLGDHLVYSKKSLMDLDATVFREWLGLDKDVETSSLGFDPGKIMSHWNLEELDIVLKERYDSMAKGVDLMLVETGCNYSYGGMMGMDSITLANKFGADMLLVAGGGVDLVVDKVLAVSRCLENNARLLGVIINKCDDDERTRMEEEVVPILDEAGIEVLGILPRERMLELVGIDHILDKLGAKLVAGSEGLENIVDKVLVGALSADRALAMPTFHQKNKLIITGGDRVDLIFASLNEDTSGIVLTNNILPHPKVMAKADELRIPLMSVPMDTYTTAKAVFNIIAEIGPSDTDKKHLIKEMVSRELDIKRILEE